MGSYIVHFLQMHKLDPFDPNSWVPGNSPLSLDTIEQDPPRQFIADNEQEPEHNSEPYIWELSFVSMSGKVYSAGAVLNGQLPPRNSGDVVNAWYWKHTEGDPGEPGLSLLPFVLRENGKDGFITPTENFADWSVEPKDYVNAKTTDSDVTAAVHNKLLPDSIIRARVGKGGIGYDILYETMLFTDFNEVLVYGGVCKALVNNVITVAKGTSCFALAVFKESEKEIADGHVPWGKGKQEYMEIVPRVWQAVIENKNGEIYEYVSLDQLTRMDPRLLKIAPSLIDQRIKILEKLKSSIMVAIR